VETAEPATSSKVEIQFDAANVDFGSSTRPVPSDVRIDFLFSLGISLDGLDYF
jgi:hypothetical protein